MSWLKKANDELLIGEELFESRARPILRKSEAYLEQAAVDIAKEMFHYYEEYRQSGEEKDKAIIHAIAATVQLGRSVDNLMGGIGVLFRNLLEDMP